MALPKRKTSKSRTRQRRAHFKVEAPPRSVCPNCSEPKAPHRVCMSCGFYKGRSVLEVAEE